MAPQRGLPKPVSALRDKLARAAVSCDWSTLQKLVRQTAGGIRFTYGLERDPIAYWKAEEKGKDSVRPMRALRLLLGLPYAKTSSAKGPTTFVWPAAFASQHPTTAQLEVIARSGLYSMNTLRSWTRSGVNYLGYRVIVTAQGKWTAFVEGD